MQALLLRLVAVIGCGLAFILIIVAFLLGRGSATANTAAPLSRATPVVATPTPTLADRTPKVIAAWSSVSLPCESCSQFTFTANGPFYIVTACNPFQLFAGSNPSLEYQIFNSIGHLLDTISKTCGNPNNDTVATNVVPEELPAGQYQIQVINPASSTILILDASQG